MSTNHHTDITTGAAATAATFNNPLAELDAAIDHSNDEYYDSGLTTTTITTHDVFYPVTGWEVAFVPAYSGQVFLVHYSIGNFYADLAGTFTARVHIVDGSSSYVYDTFLQGRQETTGTYEYHSVSGARLWTAAYGDVGVTRKAKLYVSHTTDGGKVTAGAGHIGVSVH